MGPPSTVFFEDCHTSGSLDIGPIVDTVASLYLHTTKFPLCSYFELEKVVLCPKYGFVRDALCKSQIGLSLVGSPRISNTGA